jgi:hypothetical protein
MKTSNILIPANFSLQSLNVIPALMKKFPGQKFNIKFVHFLQLSDSISELLMLSRRSREYEHVSQQFEDECRELQQQFADQIDNLHPAFFYGNTVASFKNYLEGNDISMIVIPQDYSFIKLTLNSFDPMALLQKSGCNLINIQPLAAPQPTKARIAPEHLLELQRV